MSKSELRGKLWLRPSLMDCRVLNQAAKEIEHLREEIKRLRSGSK